MTLKGPYALCFKTRGYSVVTYLYSFTLNLLLGTELLQWILNLMLARSGYNSLDFSEPEENYNHSKSHWA